MPSLFDSATGLLSKVLENAEGKTYHYTRKDGATLYVVAVRSRSYKQMMETDGAVVEFEVYDFLADAVSFNTSCDNFEPPKPGDLIKDSDTGVLFEVLRDPLDACWRYSDSNGLRVRIHTKQREIDGEPLEYTGESL